MGFETYLSPNNQMMTFYFFDLLSDGSADVGSVEALNFNRIAFSADYTKGNVATATPTPNPSPQGPSRLGGLFSKALNKMAFKNPETLEPPAMDNPLVPDVWSGEYSDGKLNLKLTKVVSGYEGIIELNGQSYNLTAKSSAEDLAGEFMVGNNAFAFNASLLGDEMRFETGNTVYNLIKVVAVNPLEAAPENPLANNPINHPANNPVNNPVNNPANNSLTNPSPQPEPESPEAPAQDSSESPSSLGGSGRNIVQGNGPALNLADFEASYQEDFNGELSEEEFFIGQNLGVDGEWAVSLVDGKYVYSNQTVDTSVRYLYFGISEGKAAVSLDVDVNSEADLNGAGLLFRFYEDDTKREYFAFAITGQNGYAVYAKEVDGGLEAIISGTSSAVKSTSNRLMVVDDGYKAELYINGRFVVSIEDANSSGHRYGLMALGMGEFQFDNFTTYDKAP
ncbi:MAG: hypothetical protein R2880_03125 [Deinococcales bacterium]